MLSKSEVESIVFAVTDYFGLPRPLVNYHFRGERGNARYSHANGELLTILNLPAVNWTGPYQLITHEVTHLLHFHTQKYYRPTTNNTPAHGLEFTALLHVVASFMLEKFNFRYDFSVEYAEVARASGVKQFTNGKRIAAVNKAMIALNLTREQAEDLVDKVENL